ncbi:MAG: hypothetical protein AAGE61_16615 [Pseudomonadota bacterium]
MAVSGKKKQSGWANYLEDGERILWEGRPDTRVFLFDRQEKYRHFLAGLWLLFMVFFFETTTGDAGDLIVNVFSSISLWLLAFLVLVFGYFLVGRWIIDAHERKHTVYALSNRRAFIARSAFGRRDLRDFRITEEMPVKFKNEDPASITFGPKPNIFQRNNKWGVEDGSFTFRGISDPKKVLQIIEKIQK